jgi:hypothetical protein
MAFWDSAAGRGKAELGFCIECEKMPRVEYPEGETKISSSLHDGTAGESDKKLRILDTLGRNASME